MTDSRAKGARAERNAARDLGKTLNWLFRRSQQFNGLGQADIVPVDRDLPVHWEVKHYGMGLKRVYGRLEDDSLVTADGMMFCLLDDLPKVIEQNEDAIEGLPSRHLKEWLAQAMRDAKQGEVPAVLCRTDGKPWVVAWYREHDDAFCDHLRTFTRCDA